MLVRCAKLDDPRPLWVVVWGGAGDVATALGVNHWNPNAGDPSIRSRVRIICIARQDGDAYGGLASIQSQLYWLENLGSFQGFYDGWGNDAYSNNNFVINYVRNHGALGTLYDYHSYRVDWWDGLREGDSPSWHYFLRGDFNNPSADHWGGSYRNDGGTHWVSDGGPEDVSQWRTRVLQAYAERFDRCLRPNTATAAQRATANAARAVPAAARTSMSVTAGEHACVTVRAQGGRAYALNGGVLPAVNTR